MAPLHRLLPLILLGTPPLHAAPPSWSGIYPHLAYFNQEGECGTGAVVPWADRLWVITYAPHKPSGSTDKLYEITPDLQLIVRPESIGGTPANRMIHRESNQLFIGPYAIDAQRNVRAIPYSTLFGRPTGLARHLTDPAGKILFATMEEGIYEVDVQTLAVRELWADEQRKQGRHANLPGYHGKGFYSSQGRYVYANNGEHGKAARVDPAIPSGALAEWDGQADAWTVVRRNQFTEVTGPGGIEGSAPDAPLWSVGWDHRSLILMLLDGGSWQAYRLPKASHSYDGAHGWNTEWPRIRDIGEPGLLMTMHGLFWEFPRTFRAANSVGIRPRSSYLKVVGDFCRWQDRLVLGCDDTANSEFINKRRAKGTIAAPQSQSNLWFVEPDRLDHLGPVIGRGAVWLNDPVPADTPSDPFLFSGLTRRAVHLATSAPATLSLEIDERGDGSWKLLQEVEVAGYRWLPFDDSVQAAWIRLRSNVPLQRATAWFTASGRDARPSPAPDAHLPEIFAGLAQAGESALTGGLLRPLGNGRRALHFAAQGPEGSLGAYLLDAEMQLLPDPEPEAWDRLQKQAAIPSREGTLEADDASVLYTDDAGRRFRLPKNPAFAAPGPLGFGRLCREVATERDLFNCHGTFFELPAENAGGFALVRPVATHNLQIHDYCSYRGLFILSGVSRAGAPANSHIIRSADGKAALWAGAVDDIWALGKPTGSGGPWLRSPVPAGAVSDPYLMTGYDRKTLALSADAATSITAEIDLTGMGDWHPWKTYPLSKGQTFEERFPDALQAYWIRFRAEAAAEVTAQLRYE